MKEFMLLIRNEIDHQATWSPKQLQRFLKECENYISGLRAEGRLKGISKNPHFIPTAALQKKFLAYISHICGAAKFFPRLAFGRTLNF